MSVESNLLIIALEAHRPGLLRFLARRLGCQDAAHDVYQGLSERLFVAPVSDDKVANPKAYLYRAASNAAHSYRRSVKARAAYEHAAAAHRGEADLRDPERALLGRDALGVVQAALSELPILTRRMFIAFRVNGETQKSIARRFGVSLSTVEKRISTASAHCHRRLSESGITVYSGKPRLSNESRKGMRNAND
ncbi:MAG: RNA polymerase sigma factor [Pseudomonadota bacterium]